MDWMDAYIGRQLTKQHRFLKSGVQNFGYSPKPITSLRLDPRCPLPENFRQKFHRQTLDAES
jgi:hypothetical protein